MPSRSLETGRAEDHQLVAATRAGDDNAFAALYGRYSSRIAGFVHGRVRDWARTEDITQEVFISALRRMRETDRPIVFRPWIFEIAKNACIDQFRRSQRGEEVSYDSAEGLYAVDSRPLSAQPATPDAIFDVREQFMHLRGALGGLSGAHQDIIVLRELEGLSYGEIGERLGMSGAGVESTLFRARRKLSEEYDEVSTGRRCARTRTTLVAAAAGPLGAREQRRVERHLAWCRGCRRQARLSGVDPHLLRGGLGAKVAALLPWPFGLRRLVGGAGHSAGAGPVAGVAGASWAKVTVAALSLVVAGTGLSELPDAAPAQPGPPAVRVSAPVTGATPSPRASRAIEPSAIRAEVAAARSREPIATARSAAAPEARALAPRATRPPVSPVSPGPHVTAPSPAAPHSRTTHSTNVQPVMTPTVPSHPALPLPGTDTFETTVRGTHLPKLPAVPVGGIGERLRRVVGAPVPESASSLRR